MSSRSCSPVRSPRKGVAPTGNTRLLGWDQVTIRAHAKDEADVDLVASRDPREDRARGQGEVANSRSWSTLLSGRRSCRWVSRKVPRPSEAFVHRTP